jgi:H+/gluconate symporter-like permease
MIIWYLNWETRRMQANGEHFTYIPGTDASKYEIDRSKLPNTVTSFIPLIVIVIMLLTMKKIIPNATELVVAAMIVGSALTLIFNWNRITNKKKSINDGLASTLGALAGPCAVVGFGTLVQNAPAFQAIVKTVLSMQMNPYVTGTVATAIIAGITGSSSGGLTITLQTMAEPLKATGANMEIMHRLMAIAAGSLDSLPHSSGLFIMLGALGLNHKEGYRFIGVTTVIMPIIICAVLTVGVILLGY